MRSFEHGYLLEQPISQSLLLMVGAIGEHRGRQRLYREQSPELLERLRRVAMIQSVESSNRIEGVTVAADRLEAIVAKKTTPKGRSEQEVAGYCDVLAAIHANANRMVLAPDLILQFYGQMYARALVPALVTRLSNEPSKISSAKGRFAAWEGDAMQSGSELGHGAVNRVTKSPCDTINGNHDATS